MKINELYVPHQMLGKDAQNKPGMKLETEEGRSGEGRAQRGPRAGVGPGKVLAPVIWPVSPPLGLCWTSWE